MMRGWSSGHETVFAKIRGRGDVWLQIRLRACQAAKLQRSPLIIPTSSPDLLGWFLCMIDLFLARLLYSIALLEMAMILPMSAPFGPPLK